MCAAGKLNAETSSPRGAGGPDVDARQQPVSGTDCGTGDSMCVGVILGFPPEIAEELQQWRASFGDPMAEVIPAHITLITTTPTQDWDATRDHVREVARQQAPFSITISGTGSFRPVSPVVFVNVEDGFEECVRLHERLQTGPLERLLPFPYHPHVTVAHDVAPESLDEAETVLQDYSATFPVVSMGLYEHDSNGIWQLREELDFGSDSHEAREAESSSSSGQAAAAN
ncbi:2'-5' RNA ligase family protein [Arthrobacter cavernae]|uniref:2'-5' RNA ligase family protein n=1 Tax=Arthrobacter cavernae TaxID=2817681 RepID=A0A939HFW9_9MICC|nr:2'-5' RNA ligase family protein [Arthrobacter cavernae]MBO1266573.1 2'-5' RNA ligase family protein [Arthrobacter cavernae]